MKSLGLAHLSLQVVERIRNMLLVENAFEENFDGMVCEYDNISPALAKYLHDRKLQISSCSYKHVLYFTNSSECVNAKLKSFLSYKSNTLVSCLSILLTFFSNEQGKATDTYIGMSQVYKVGSKFSTFFERCNFYSLSEKEKQDLLGKYNTVTVETLMHDNNVYTTGSTDFSIIAENCKISVPLDILQQMYCKASEIIRNDGKVLPAPSTSVARAYCCASTVANAGVNYQIKINLKDWKVECQCKGYRVYHICSHAIAAAQIDGTLYNYIQWHRCKFSKMSVPMGVFTQSVDTTRSGLKANQSTGRKRKTAKPSTATRAKTKRPFCAYDHELDGIVKIVNLRDHTRVSTCYQCKRKDMAHVKYNGFALSQKVYKSYPHPHTRKPTLTLNKEPAYFHVNKKCMPIKNIHVCPGTTTEATDLLIQKGYSWYHDDDPS